MVTNRLLVVSRSCLLLSTLDFSGYTSMVEAGLMTPEEAVVLAEIDARTPHETTWAPMLWAST